MNAEAVAPANAWHGTARRQQADRTQSGHACCSPRARYASLGHNALSRFSGAAGSPTPGTERPGPGSAVASSAAPSPHRTDIPSTPSPAERRLSGPRRIGARRVVAIICAQSAWSRCVTGHSRHGARDTADRADVVDGSGMLVSQRRIFCVRGASRNEMLPQSSGKAVLRRRREAANSQAAASGVTVRPVRMPFPPR
jgi:hypothetical protein